MNKDSISLYAWTGEKNFGDIIIFDILKKYKINYNLVSAKCCDIITIGSILHNFLVSKNSNFLESNVYVWGSGFISDNTEELIKLIGKFEYIFNRNMKFYAVRGKLTKGMIENILMKKIDVILGDPGLLAKKIYKNDVKKKYDVGIVLHWKENSNEILNKIKLERYSYNIISPMDDPEVVITSIRECSCILSSSLHGLIIADSFSIPNRHIIVSDKVEGGSFKFMDYYSAYENYEYKKIEICNESINDTVIDNVIGEYINRGAEIDKICNELISAFPKCCIKTNNILIKIYKYISSFRLYFGKNPAM